MVVVGGLLTAIGCQGDQLGPVANPELPLQVLNDTMELAQRVTDLPDVLLQIMPPDTTAPFESHMLARAPTTLELRLNSQVLPPQIEGVSLQASHIVVSNNIALVSYNLAGSDFRGGVDVFSTGTRPRLRSQGLANGWDVSSVAATATKVFLASATSTPGFSSPAGLIEVGISGRNLQVDQVRVIDLPSFVSTSAWTHNGELFVTTGSSVDGGLFQLDVTDLSTTTLGNYLDARAVAVDDDYIVAMTGAPATLYVYDRLSGTSATYAVGGATVPDAKSGVAIADGHAFVAAGEAGLKIVRLVDGAVVFDVPMSTMTNLVDADAQTNSVTVNQELVFVANGGAGLYVLRHSGLTTASPILERIGRVVFPGASSANHVGSRRDNVFVATGNGGLQVVRIRNR